MIVNTAYIYMGNGGGGGTPVNPNLWQDGVSNYPVEFTLASISAEGLVLNSSYSKASDATFSELQLIDFTSLVISGRTLGYSTSNITIEFFDSDLQSLGKQSVPISRSQSTKTVNIPSQARIKNAKIKIRNASGFQVILSSALLT